jgi:LPS export ABC transporter permease LptF/LPS export ABC transporter permease LptG
VILDRYLIREIALPFLIGLTALTFLLELPPILVEGEKYIAAGLEWSIVVRLLVTLLPQALSLTIPMATLLGILVAFGRLSADREFVALQACGVSQLRLLRPLVVIGALGTAATAYETLVALPNANQTFREIVYVELATRVETRVKPRVFYDDFPDKVIYVRDLPPGGGWTDVFLADTATPNQMRAYLARQGRIRLDPVQQVVQVELVNGTSHIMHTDRPGDYEETSFESVFITLDPSTVFKRPPPRGPAELTLSDLREQITRAAASSQPAYAERFMFQQKLSLPLTCPILVLMGLALGVSNRKDGRLASFALGFGVIFIYYVVLWGARAAAQGGQLSPEWAPWVPNIIMGAAAVVLLLWRRAPVAQEPRRFRVPAWRRRAAPAEAGPRPSSPGAGRPSPVILVRVPRLTLPHPRLLDVYVSRDYLRIVALAVLSLLGVFYISTFIDLADKLFRGEATSAMLLRFFYFRTPQFVYYVIPMAVLVSTLVTVGALTKNSELLVMQACGISLYRISAPLIVFGLAASAVLFLMQERVLAHANREADRLERIMRRWAPLPSAANRRWMVGTNGDLYHYELFDAEADRFSGLWMLRLDQRAWRLHAITRATQAAFAGDAGDEGAPASWRGRDGWTRELGAVAPRVGEKAVVKFEQFAERVITLDPPGYFKTEEPLAEMMTYGQLRDYVTRLRASGANVVPQMVALQRKLAFPFVTVIMTLLAVPFAVTTGRRGALYGVGTSLVLAIAYWLMLSVSGALGAAGVMSPALAAWAPNILFGAAAGYLVLTVRT